MSWTESIRDLLPPVDPRTPLEVEGDIEDEFTFHLAMLEREERAAGCDDETARSHARKRFGDIERFRKKCKKIALEERVMLQRINFVLMIIVIGFLFVVHWQVWHTQKHNALALNAITTDLARMKFEAEAEARDADTEGTKATPQTADDIVSELKNNTTDHDLRDLPGIWQLVDRDDLPEAFQLLFVNDQGQRVPEGMIKKEAKPAATIIVEQIGLAFALRPEAHTVQNSELMQLEVKIQPAGGSPSERYGNPQTTVYSTWTAPTENRIALHLDPLLEQMTAEAAATAQSWFEKPLVYERVTAPYSDVIKVGRPVYYHLLGDIPNPGARKMSAREPLMLQKVLWEQNFGAIEGGVAALFHSTMNGSRIVASVPAKSWEHEAYATIVVEPDSVIYITTTAPAAPDSAADDQSQQD